MKTILGSRASAVLYNWLISNNIKGRVLIPANICESVPAVYYKAGIKVTICDIEFGKWTPSKEIITDIFKQNKNINIFHYNHTYGGGDNNDFLFSLKKMFPDLIIIEDFCLSIPFLEAKETVSDLSLFSTGHTKTVNIGYGGYAFSKNNWTYKPPQLNTFSEEELQQFKKHIKECHNTPQKVDLNILKGNWINMDDYNYKNYFTKIKTEKIKILKHKKEINNIYNYIFDNIKNLTNKPTQFPANMQHWRYNILVENQQECLKALFSEKLFASKHYMSLGNGYFQNISTPNCNWLEAHVINLFNDWSYSVEQAEKTVEILKKIAVLI